MAGERRLETGGGDDDGGGAPGRGPGSKIWRPDTLNGRRTGVGYIGTWSKRTVVEK